MNRDARAELVRLGMLELQSVRGRLAKVTTDDVAHLLDLVDAATPLTLGPGPDLDRNGVRVVTLTERMDRAAREPHAYRPIGGPEARHARCNDRCVCADCWRPRSDRQAHPTQDGAA